MEARDWLWRVGNRRRRVSVCCRPDCDLSKPCAVVRQPCQTSLQSSQLDLCAGLDNPLCADGLRRMANPAATPNLGSTTLCADLVFCSAYAECSMVVDVFRR